MGMPMTGSDAAKAIAVYNSVKNDPKFAGADPGAIAIEADRRAAVVKGTILSPETIHNNALMMVAGKMAPPAEGRTGASDTLAEAYRIDPNFDPSAFARQQQAKLAITTGGSLFQPISSMNVTMGHAEHFLDLATQLGNYGGGNWANTIPNKLASGSGQGRLVNNLKQTAFAMAEEANRIYAGNAGTETAIDEWKKAFPVDGSLAEQAGAVQNLAQLMGDKFDTLTYQANHDAGNNGPTIQLLTPKAAATYQRLISMDIPGAKTAGGETTGTTGGDVGRTIGGIVGAVGGPITSSVGSAVGGAIGRAAQAIQPADQADTAGGAVARGIKSLLPGNANAPTHPALPPGFRVLQ
jgi:hypothetical protein